ncbi:MULTISPECIES: iron-sulfur cluster assembly scaffold protein [unclassified Rathayibacter]|uniref:iron-sulfur cluster assembly scaffold protein n=1 Tax=unclassified Rathayibacter TaxID=2609250 RepID=UPI001889D516|nr:MULTISPECIES: iron-sulfur cluster assembly scaffold protein [unclassified Rathayibacter]MBF4462128.1 iron-sulfur cluster assembly scaffold protein [Rathayibacter sp. VKM Ac-2879]MBF4503829.1 iron-sulfur cluster assembly scaffold protein [Rathayibacter sp. VKM Ac-2878]
MSAAAELIRAHAKDPVGFSENAATALGRAELITPSCGDRLEVRVDGDADRLRLGWSGRGCEVARGSASVLVDELDGLGVAEVRSRREEFLAAMGRREGPLAGQESALLAVAGNPVRAVCATLAWRALGAALDEARLG